MHNFFACLNSYPKDILYFTNSEPSKLKRGQWYNLTPGIMFINNLTAAFHGNSKTPCGTIQHWELNNE